MSNVGMDRFTPPPPQIQVGWPARRHACLEARP